MYCLADPIKNLSLLETLSFFLGRYYSFVHVTCLTVHHDNTEIAVFISKGVFITDNIGMP